MVFSYQIRVHNTSGVLQTIIDNFDYLEITHRSNQYSTHRIDMNGNDPRIELFTKDAIIEVKRKSFDLGIDWYTEYVGFHRTKQHHVSGRRVKFTSYGRGLLDLLHRRSMLYFAGAGKSGPADSVITEYVDENAGPGATQPPRLYPGVTTGLIINPAAGTAGTWTGQRTWTNLLETIQEIAEAHSVDMDISWDGGQSFTFRTFYPRSGSDKTSGTSDPVIFSTYFNNMSEPSLTEQATEEINQVIVLGQGQEEDRETLLVENATAVAESPWNQIEKTHDAREQDDSSDLLHEGQENLEEVEAKISLAFETLQSPQLAYGKHYVIGDLVTAQFANQEFDIKVMGAHLVIAEGKEDIDIEFGDPE